MLMTRGCGCDGSFRAFRNSGLAAWASRRADNRKSIVEPAESMAPIPITPVALDPNAGFIDTPGLIGGLEVTPEPLLEFGAITLHPTPHRRVIGGQAALLQELFDLA